MKLALISSVYGESFHKASLQWVLVNQPYLPENVEICLVSLDGVEMPLNNSSVKYSFCDKNKRRLIAGDGDLPRLEKIIEYCSMGYTCLHMDLDVVLFKNITPLLVLPYYFVISRAFSFPKSVVDKIGFVGCTGFYIAKPDSLPFLLQWHNDIIKSDQVDQFVINKIFSNLIWKNKVNKVAEYSTKNDLVSYWNKLPILVLSSTLLPRNKKGLSKHSFGLHNPEVMQEYWGLI